MREWAMAFLLTEVIELPVYAVALMPRPLFRRLLLAAVPSLLTHPFVWITVLWLGHTHYHGTVAAAELFAVTVEGLYVQLLGVRRALLWALAANGLSLAGGMAYYEFRFQP